MRSTIDIVIDGKTRRLDPTQSGLLNAGLRRPDGALLPAPDFVPQDLAHLDLAIASLVRRGLARMEDGLACIAPRRVSAMLDADPHGGPIACRQALELPVLPERYQAGGDGVEAGADAAETTQPDSKVGPGARRSASQATKVRQTNTDTLTDRIEPNPNPARPRKPGKLGTIAQMLTAPSGASLEQLTTTTGWLPHSVRAGMTGLRKQGHIIERSSVEGITRFAIRVQPAQADA